MINLPSYRPELKGGVEKFFDLVQDSFKPYLKGKGVIEPVFQERGVHDYRKDACLTMEEFERIVLHCVIYYNSQRIIENYPYTDEMLKTKVKPYANTIYEWGRNQSSVNLMDVDYIPESCEYNLQHESEGCFITEKEALSYADAHRPEPPYEYWRDALSWMDVERYVPYHSGWYYVRMGEYVCKAYYEKEKAGFYDGDERICVVTAWITSLIGLDAALHAWEYEQT